MGAVFLCFRFFFFLVDRLKEMFIKSVWQMLGINSKLSSEHKIIIKASIHVAVYRIGNHKASHTR